MSPRRPHLVPARASLASPFSPIEEALQELRAGRMVVVCDAEDRENEGDLTLAAQFATPAAINFMAVHGRGLICLALTPERCDELGLEMMVEHNEAPYGTAFTISIEARNGISTGISAADRAHTIQVAIDPTSGPLDIISPGHMFPLRARPGGALERTGQTEAAVDLARLAGLYPAGVICEVMNLDGTMARVPDLERFCAEHQLKMVAISDLVEYRRARERSVERVADTRMPTRFGDFRAIGYHSTLDDKHHVAFVQGDVSGDDVLVRVHSECLTGDVFGSLRCDCGVQLADAMQRITAEGRGVVVYLAQEGRGIGLLNKLRAYELQEQGLDTVDANAALGLPADLRDYEIGAQILADLGVNSVRLMTNNPRKIWGLERHGARITRQVPIEHPASEHNLEYLRTKALRLGHMLRGASLMSVAPQHSGPSATPAATASPQRASGTPSPECGPATPAAAASPQPARATPAAAASPQRASGTPSPECGPATPATTASPQRASGTPSPECGPATPAAAASPQPARATPAAAASPQPARATPAAAASPQPARATPAAQRAVGESG